jgi:hypothetical protein
VQIKTFPKPDPSAIPTTYNESDVLTSLRDGTLQFITTMRNAVPSLTAHTYEEKKQERIQFLNDNSTIEKATK